jgi:hypothetical protein
LPSTRSGPSLVRKWDLGWARGSSRRRERLWVFLCAGQLVVVRGWPVSGLRAWMVTL